MRIANRERYNELYFTDEARAEAAALRSAGNSFPAPGDVVQGRATDRPGVIAAPLPVPAVYTHSLSHTHTHTHTHMYSYMYMYPGLIAGPLLVYANIYIHKHTHECIYVHISRCDCRTASCACYVHTHTHTHTHTHMYVYMYIYPGVIAGPLLVHAKFPLTDQSLALCSNAIRLTMASLHKRVSLSSI